MLIDARKMENVMISPVIIVDDKGLKSEYSKFCINRGMKYDFGTKIVCLNPKNKERVILCNMTIAYDNMEDFDAFCEEFGLKKGYVDD